MKFLICSAHSHIQSSCEFVGWKPIGQVQFSKFTCNIALEGLTSWHGPSAYMMSSTESFDEETVSVKLLHPLCVF